MHEKILGKKLPKNILGGLPIKKKHSKKVENHNYIN